MSASGSLDEQLSRGKDAESKPVGSTRKKKNVKEGRSQQSSEAIPEEADATKARKENRGKAIEVSSGESEEEDDSENTDSDEVEEVDVEDVKPSISTKAKTTSAAAPSEKIKRGLTSEERLAEQRYASVASIEIIPERSEVREAEKKAQRQAKKKVKSALTSTAAPPSGPPPSTPHSERKDPFGYVPPRQSSRSAGKFQIIHLGSIAAPGQPIDADEATLALDTASAAIQQLATAMQTLTSVVGQIASMLYLSKSSIWFFIFSDLYEF
ncbi:hypothetical protein Bca4012_070427 [Brassica carinata]